jgi:hypothetical protein
MCIQVGDHGPLDSTILEYVCRDKGTTTNLRMTSTPADIRTQYLSNIIKRIERVSVELFERVARVMCILGKIQSV